MRKKIEYLTLGLLSINILSGCQDSFKQIEKAPESNEDKVTQYDTLTKQVKHFETGEQISIEYKIINGVLKSKLSHNITSMNPNCITSFSNSIPLTIETCKLSEDLYSVKDIHNLWPNISLVGGPDSYEIKPYIKSFKENKELLKKAGLMQLD